MISITILCPYTHKEEAFKTNGGATKMMQNNRLINVKDKGTIIYTCSCEYYGNCPYSKTNISCNAFITSSRYIK